MVVRIIKIPAIRKMNVNGRTKTLPVAGRPRSLDRQPVGRTRGDVMKQLRRSVNRDYRIHAAVIFEVGKGYPAMHSRGLERRSCIRRYVCALFSIDIAEDPVRKR